MAFFAFLYRLVMPNGKHIYNYCLPKPPGTHAQGDLSGMQLRLSLRTRN